MEKFLQFIMNNKYPIIGAAIAILIIVTGLYHLIIPIALVILGIYAGVYFQKIKKKLKKR